MQTFGRLKAAPEGAGGSIGPAHLALLQRYGGKNGERLLAAVAAGQLLAPAASRLYRRLRRRDDFTITVPATDDVYPALHEWVLERMPEEERKALIAMSLDTRFGGWVPVPHDNPKAPRLRLLYDGDRQQQVMIGGHRVQVVIAREEFSAAINGLRERVERIVFTAPSAAGRDAVVSMIERVLASQHEDERAPALFIPSRGGSEWVRQGDLPTRPLSSTILKEGQLERLVADLGAFLSAREDYDSLSQPWHRGYLFHGAPGTGKTSVARALASHFGLRTYYLPLADIDRDANLMQLVAGIGPRSMLLLEDVDAYRTATSRAQGTGDASIAAMLNSLDGIWTPPGLVTVMTTNHRDALDPALVRAGRVDVDEELTVLDLDQAERMLEAFGRADLAAERFVGDAPASLIQAMRRSQLARPAALA